MTPEALPSPTFALTNLLNGFQMNVQLLHQVLTTLESWNGGWGNLNPCSQAVVTQE